MAPLKTATTEGVVRIRRTDLPARFGVPKIINSDNGTQFTCRPFSEILTEWGVKHQLTAPYTPQENAVARANRVVKMIIAQCCEHKKRTWDELLPEIMLAVNTAVSEITGHSPAFVVHWREPRLPGTLYYEATPSTGTIPETAQQRAERLTHAHQLVRRNLQLASQTQARHYNLRR